MRAEIVREQLYQLNLHNTIGPDVIIPTVLEGVELVDVTAKPLSTIKVPGTLGKSLQTGGQSVLFQYTKKKKHEGRLR